MSELVYHYTKLDALVGILQSVKGEEQNLIFWGTRHDCMNDPEDYTFAADVVVPRMIESIKDMEELDESESEYVEDIPYIVSFTENKDDDFMWLFYKAEVALELDANVLDSLNGKSGIISMFWDKCEYVEEDKLDDAFINKWKEARTYLSNLPTMAQHTSVFIKRKAFEREREWRLYSSASKLYMVTEEHGVDNIETSVNPVNVKCVSDGDIILYMEFKIPREALKGIIINDVDVKRFHKIKKHIEVLLAKKGISSKTISIRQTNRYPLK